MKKLTNTTLDDVAKLAKVSRATVSRAINTPEKISPEVLERTNRAIAQLRYTPNRFARALTLGRTHTIGLVFFEDVRTLFTNPFWGDILNPVYENLSLNNMSCNLIAQGATEMSGIDSSTNFYEKFVSQGNADGYIFFGEYPEIIEKKFGFSHLPIAIFGKPYSNYSEFSYVDTDNMGGATKAVKYLAKKGRKKIAIITGPIDHGGGFDRFLGYKNGLVESGLKFDPNLVAHATWTTESGALAMEEILSKTKDFDAIFVSSDLMAIGALRVLHNHGLRVPEDVALVSFDNSSIAGITSPTLTSVEQPFSEIGKELVTAVMRSIDGVSHQSQILGTRIVERESA